MVHDTELMSSGAHESEDALARLACAKLPSAAEPVILIGGLGMGYTLAATLKEVGPAAKVIVAELIPGVVEWNRGPLAHLAGNPLSDPRVSVRVQDIALSLQTELQAFDAILLDVDNGPEGLTRDSNNWLYSPDGLTAAYTALRPGGVLAVWSSTPEKTFAMRLRKMGFEVEEVRVASSINVQQDERHTIWLAVNRA
jgi:spermidine synthase